MRGEILFYDRKTREGVIQDSNHDNYNFHMGEWLSRQPVKVGEEVIFDIPKEEAINIRVVEVNFFTRFFKKGKMLFSFVYRGRD